MSKSIVEVRGFDELQRKLMKLSDDKSKRSEVQKLLGQVANITVKAAKSLAPVAKKPHIQKRKGQRFGTVVMPGTGKKSIGKKVMRKAANPMIYVSPRSVGKGVDGWYLRQFVIPGTKKQRSQPFMDQAYNQTQGQVTAEAEAKMEKYIQKQIDKLSN